MTKQELDHGYYVAQKDTATYKERNARGSGTHRAQVKIKVLAHYGPQGRLQCSWSECMVTDIDMLSLDHVNNDGACDREKHGKTGGWLMYCRLIRLGFPEGFQTLCH